jgi:hypothetical protein
VTKKWNSKAGFTRGKQVKEGIKTVRNGQWYMTILERGRAYNTYHFFGWSNVEIVRRQARE